MTRDRMIGLLALGAMFALGLVCGLWLAPSRGEVGDRGVPGIPVTPDVTQISEAEHAGTARAHHEASLRDLQKTVGLDEAQMEQVHAVFARNQRVVQAAWQTVQPQIEIAMEKVHREVADLLRPEQRGAYHQWLLSRRGERDPHAEEITERDARP